MSNRPDHFHQHRFPAEVMSYTVWPHYRFPTSHRDVEELLHERGIRMSRQTVRDRAPNFRPLFMGNLRRRAERSGRTWHLDEIAVGIAGRPHWLWPAVDEHTATRDVLL